MRRVLLCVLLPRTASAPFNFLHFLMQWYPIPKLAFTLRACCCESWVKFLFSKESSSQQVITLHSSLAVDSPPCACCRCCLQEVGNVAAFLVSPLASAITGHCCYVDNGLNIMGLAMDSKTLEREA
jgi:hypothetical protein